MPKHNKTNIISVFGQIEGVVADALVSEGKAKRIAASMVPETVRYDDQGRTCHCALVLSPEVEREFDLRVADLYR